jgi:glucosamine-6-phosphate deaminase
MLVKLDDNTISNAVQDGHFATVADSPHYAVTMGAELVYQARTVVLLANGERKTAAVTRSLLDDVTPAVPISYGQAYAAKGGTLIYVVDAVAGRDLADNKKALRTKGIVLKDMTKK